MKLWNLRAAICGLALVALFDSAEVLAQTTGAAAGAAAGNAAAGIAGIPATSIAVGAVGVVAASAILGGDDDETTTVTTTQ